MCFIWSFKLANDAIAVFGIDADLEALADLNHAFRQLGLLECEVGNQLAASVDWLAGW